MKTSTNTAAAAQIGAVKRMVTTADDSTAMKKQEVGSKLRDAICISPLLDSFAR